MRGCALRKVVRNLAHKKLENRGVEPQHLPSQIPRPAPTGWSPVGWWMAEKPGAEGSPRSPGEKLPLSDHVGRTACTKRFTAEEGNRTQIQLRGPL